MSMLCYVCNMLNARNDFALGFVLGQASAYIEQVNAGAKLAAQIGCAEEYVPNVVDAATKDGCSTIIEDRGFGRAAVWIFRASFVRSVIADFNKKTHTSSASDVWAMGKLFGYSDSAIEAYIQAHGLFRSASDSESSPRPCSGSSDSHTERVHCAY